MDSAIIKENKVSEAEMAGFTRPGVTLILPFDPKMTGRGSLSASLTNAADEVAGMLGRSYPASVVKLMKERLETVFSNLNYATLKKSIVVYLTPTFEKVIYLDFDVKQQITVDATLRMTNLVVQRQQQQKFLVLVLGGKESSMFMGNSSALVKIVSIPLKPVYAFVRDRPERVGNFSDRTSMREVVLNKMIRHIDDSLGQVLNAYDLPVFVVGGERVVGHFKNLTRHRKRITCYLPHNAAGVDASVLLEILEPAISNWKAMMARHYLQLLEQAESQQRLATGIKDVWAAAANHCGRMLVIENRFINIGTDAKIPVLFIPPRNSKPLSPGMDVVDELIQMVFESGGDVEIVDDGVLSQHDGIALIKFH